MKKLLYFLLLIPGILYSQPTPVGPFTFGKGVNYDISATDIPDDSSPDMCNCVSEIDGSVQKRYGNKKYINQAVSSYPVTSLFNAYASSNGVTSRSILFTNKNSIYYSTGGLNPLSVKVSSNNYADRWNWVSMAELGTNGLFKDYSIGVGGYYNDIKKFDVITSSISDLLQSDSSTSSIIVRAKYATMAKNYFIVGNVRELKNKTDLISNTTFYPSRVYYSLLAKPSSMTALRFIDYKTSDGEEITNVSSLFDNVHIWKPSSIGELNFSVLNVASAGGDQQLTEIVNGFGLFAPQSLASNGQFYIFCSKDGVRTWDGGRRGRLTAIEESRNISNGKIGTLVRRLISAGTWNECVGYYYNKRDWYILNYRDPEKFPKDNLNSSIIYDFKNQEWYPLCNLQMGPMAAIESGNDKQVLLYGDSNDGYIYNLDLNTRYDDEPKELVVDAMEDQSQWAGSSQNISSVIEGTSSLKINTSTSVFTSTMSIVKTFNLGEWKDGTKVSRSDNLKLSIYPESLGNISSVRIDLLFDSTGTFNQYFSSVSFSSASFSGGNAQWSNFSVPFSSFVIPSDWASLDSETVPFAKTLTYYGVRIVLNSISESTISVDNIRIVQSSDNPISAYRKTKLFDFGTKGYKGMGQLILTSEKSPDSEIKIDVYNDFGNKILTKSYPTTTPQEIIVMYGSSMSILNSVNFEVIKSTVLNFNFYNGVADNDFIYTYDRSNRKIVKLKRDSFGLVVSSFGSLGSGTTNFNTVHQMSMDKNYLRLVDMRNQRVKQHSKNDLSFYQMSGTLGLSATSYHQPTGIASDQNSTFVSNEGNYSLFKLENSTFGFINSVQIDYNTIGESSLAVDDSYIYLAYQKFTNFTSSEKEIIIEKRDKGDLRLINRTNIKEEFSNDSSTRTISGDICIIGKHLYISFMVGLSSDASRKFYVQKLLKDDLSLVKQYNSNYEIFSILGYPYSYESLISTQKIDLNSEGKYFQLKFYNDTTSGFIRLFNQSFLAEPRQISY